MNELVSSIKALIFDMDGVLWRGEQTIGDLPKFFEQLDTLKLNYAFATNNSAKTPEHYLQRFANFGVKIELEQVNTSAEVTGNYIASNYPADISAFVIGEIGLHEALSKRGIKIVDTHSVASGSYADLVVMGLSRQFSYDDVAAATILIQKGASYIGSNADKSFPVEDGIRPGAGAVQAIVNTATGITPVVMGKPETPMYLDAARKLGLEPSQIIFVGDRLDTDVEGAIKSGMKSILVLSGVATKEDAENSAVKPDFILDSIHDIPQLFKYQL